MQSEASQEARLAWLALVLSPGMGPTRCARVMARLGAPERLFGLALTELEGTGMPVEAAHFVFDGRARKAAMEEAGADCRCGRDVDHTR